MCGILDDIEFQITERKQWLNESKNKLLQKINSNDFFASQSFLTECIKIDSELTKLYQFEFSLQNKLFN